MNLTIPALIEKIKAQTFKTAKSEGAAVLETIELGRLYKALKTRVKKGLWAKTLKGIDVEARVADRYITIGESWWAADQTHGSDSLPLDLLPCDLHKLCWICRLTPEQLSNFLKIFDCKRSSRGTVIKAVQRLKGDQRPASEDQPVTVKTLKKKWKYYVGLTVQAICNLKDGEIDETVRQELLDEMLASFSDVEEALAPSQPAQDEAAAFLDADSADEPGEDAGESSETTNGHEAEASQEVTQTRSLVATQRRIR
jgi:hypothetical protein